MYGLVFFPGSVFQAGNTFEEDIKSQKTRNEVQDAFVLSELDVFAIMPHSFSASFMFHLSILKICPFGRQLR